jgi:hypothetical protein
VGDGVDALHRHFLQEQEELPPRLGPRAWWDFDGLLFYIIKSVGAVAQVAEVHCTHKNEKKADVKTPPHWPLPPRPWLWICGI